MENNKITVFGASGNIGSLLIHLLSKAQIETIAVTRDFKNATDLPFVQWVQADISHKESLYATMENSKAAFLLSGNSPTVVEDQINVIDVAKELAIKHIVKLSSGAADPSSTLYIPRIHGQIEHYLITSGIHYTMLRPNGIMQNWLGEIANAVREERKFNEATGDGKRAHVDRRDIADVAFACLAGPETHFDKTYLLTSDKAVNYYDVAIAISNAINEKVTYCPISPEQAKQDMEEKNMPAALIETFLAYDRAQRNGETEIVTNCVSTILGRPARTLTDFATAYATCFK
ncbi:NmrA family NAD(P)-binding protein [Chitinophaga sp. Cy-1792]|uniref:NmrA family NAD(P)-binding protein n=1 Tax=Chitinophaga sp. Cy-1792 TaxID=2608339 RepID=UPI00142353F3|nr:NmrA family NAD(P)-binding protein [Chitinophaga sp. Cy-1792]NIG53864.1 NAD(P)H-binding protein [Chitinophaga sp. Cy-1792]